MRRSVTCQKLGVESKLSTDCLAERLAWVIGVVTGSLGDGVDDVGGYRLVIQGRGGVDEDDAFDGIVVLQEDLRCVEGDYATE